MKFYLLNLFGKRDFAVTASQPTDRPTHGPTDWPFVSRQLVAPTAREFSWPDCAVVASPVITESVAANNDASSAVAGWV